MIAGVGHVLDAVPLFMQSMFAQWNLVSTGCVGDAHSTRVGQRCQQGDSKEACCEGHQQSGKQRCQAR